MKNKIKQLEEELHEQCVLNGKGSEREADLLAKVERLERENAALRVQVEELDAKWKMAEAHCFDQVGKIGELKRENAALRQKLELSSNNQTDEYICVDREHGLWKRKNKTL